MAYAFNGTTQYLSMGSVPVSAFGVTFSAWVKTTSTGTFKHAVNTSTDASTNEYLTMNKTDADSYWGAGMRSSPSGTTITNISTGTTAMADGVWHHVAGVYTSASSVQAFLDGIGATAGTTNITRFPNGMNRFTIGAFGRNTTSAYWDGDIAVVGVWSAALNADEIAALAKGFSPRRVRPQSLVFSAPMIRTLQDIRQAISITNNNTATVADHPRVY